jgi:hypothetical protein
MVERKDPIWVAEWYSVMDMTFKPLILSNTPLYCCQVRPVHTDVVCHSPTNML